MSPSLIDTARIRLGLVLMKVGFRLATGTRFEATVDRSTVAEDLPPETLGEGQTTVVITPQAEAMFPAPEPVDEEPKRKPLKGSIADRMNRGR